MGWVYFTGGFILGFIVAFGVLVGAILLKEKSNGRTNTD